MLLPGVTGITTSGVIAQEDNSPRVWNVSIEGNETFEAIVLKKQIFYEAPSLLSKLKFWQKVGLKLDESEVKRDVIRLQRFYQRRGFDDVKVFYDIQDLSKPWRKKVLFRIIENEPIRIKNVYLTLRPEGVGQDTVSSNSLFFSIQKNLPYRTNDRYEPANDNDTKAKISGQLRNLGYPYASTEIKAATDSAAKATDLTVIARTGPKARFDSVLVEGEKNLDPKLIIRETNIHEGEIFSDHKLREAQREIFNHHMLRFALISIPDQPKDSTLNIRIRVKETSLRSLQLRFGIGNLTRIDNGSDLYKLFRGRVTWTHRNMRGEGERLTISANASAIEQRIGSDYLFPYLFNTKTSLIISPFAEHKLEPSYELLRGGINNSFVYQYSPNFTGTISYQLTGNNESVTNSQESLPDSIDSYNVSSFNLNAFYSKDRKNGRIGWSVQPYWELSGLFRESTFSFQKVGMDLRKFTALSDNMLLANRVNLSGIYYARQDSLPADIRIYSGGTNSVRGWNRHELGPKRAILDENGQFSRYVPIGGRAAFAFNSELRIRINQLIKGMGIAVFLDGGRVWRNFMDIGSSNLQFGAGGGLRYQSPIGPVRVDIAYKINPTDEDLRIYNGIDYGSAWDRWGIHFSIGQAF